MSIVNQQNNELISDSIVETEEWNEIISSRYFIRLVNFISNKIVRYSKEIEKLSIEPSLDTSFKVSALAAKKEELNSLLRKFEFYKEQYRLYQIDKQKRGN